MVITASWWPSGRRAMSTAAGRAWSPCPRHASVWFVGTSTSSLSCRRCRITAPLPAEPTSIVATMASRREARARQAAYPAPERGKQRAHGHSLSQVRKANNRGRSIPQPCERAVSAPLPHAIRNWALHRGARHQIPRRNQGLGVTSSGAGRRAAPRRERLRVIDASHRRDGSENQRAIRMSRITSKPQNRPGSVPRDGSRRHPETAHCTTDEVVKGGPDYRRRRRTGNEHAIWHICESRHHRGGDA